MSLPGDAEIREKKSDQHPLSCELIIFVKRTSHSSYIPIIICGFFANMSACDIISIPPTITAVDSNEVNLRHEVFEEMCQ